MVERQDRITQIRARIELGTYVVDPQAVAAAVMQRLPLALESRADDREVAREHPSLALVAA